MIEIPMTKYYCENCRYETFLETKECPVCIKNKESLKEFKKLWKKKT